MRKLGFLSLLLLVSTAHASEYFNDTYASLECMRRGTQLIPDGAVVTPVAGLCPIQVSSLPTSPSNIALDLLVQLEALQQDDLSVTARANIFLTIQVLQRIQRHHPSGMFYSRYTTGDDRKSPVVVDSFLSSVDNLHLAYALWVLGEVGPEESRAGAMRLFSAMKFDFFYDAQDGLFVGGARFVNGQLVREKWKYRYFGSEARSLYGISWALGLVKDPALVSKAMRSLDADLFTWDERGRGRQEVMGLWDGGAFQLLLPRVLISEERYSPRLGEMFKAYGRYVIQEGERLGFSVPASHSACQFDRIDYIGKAGSVALVTPRNTDLAEPGLRGRWDSVFTAHAAFLASPLLSLEFSRALSKARTLVDQEGVPLYKPGLGWMDALHVRGARAGRVIPVQLSFDQAIIALTTSEASSEGAMTVGARALNRNPRTQARLGEFYRAVDGLLERAPVYQLASPRAGRSRSSN